MIDRKTLKELGWTDKLIDEFISTANRLPKIKTIDTNENGIDLDIFQTTVCGETIHRASTDYS